MMPRMPVHRGCVLNLDSTTVRLRVGCEARTPPEMSVVLKQDRDASKIRVLWREGASVSSQWMYSHCRESSRKPVTCVSSYLLELLTRVTYQLLTRVSRVSRAHTSSTTGAKRKMSMCQDLQSVSDASAPRTPLVTLSVGSMVKSRAHWPTSMTRSRCTVCIVVEHGTTVFSVRM